MPIQLKASGALGPTGWAKTSYTMVTVTQITMASTLGCRMIDAAQALIIQTVGVHKKDPANAIPDVLLRAAERC